MKARCLVIGLIAASAVCSLVWADTVEMRDGTLVNGKYVGGTAGTVRVETPEGVKVVETSQVLALTFAAANGAPATAPAGAGAGTPTAQAPAAAAAVPAAAQQPAAATAPPAAPASITLPAGTVLTVRIDTQVSS